MKENKLYVFVPGQPDYETVFVEEQTFNLKALQGYSVKFEDVVAGKATALSFIQPNGVFKALRKK